MRKKTPGTSKIQRTDAERSGGSRDSTSVKQRTKAEEIMTRYRNTLAALARKTR